MIGLNKLHRTRRGLGALALSACLLLSAASTVLTVELMSAAQLEAAELPAPALVRDVPDFAQENDSPLLVQLNNERGLAPEPDNIESLHRPDAAASDILHASNSADSQNEQAHPNLNPISIVEPEYPGRALIRGIEGYAQVEFTVTATGGVEDVRISSSQPARTFDRSAISAASQLRFDPILQDGEAVAVEGVRYKFHYKLVNDGPWAH